jgi:DNA (cytosine-5)-methyltransferase 1
MNMAARIKSFPQIKAIDLFCGIGGLTHGLIQEGFEVVAGIDNDASCKFGYEQNNGAKFLHKDILQVSGDEINELFGKRGNTVRVLVGCAPCQPFSKLNQKKITKNQLEPLGKFAQLIALTKPDIVSMENVSGLGDKKKYPVFKMFLKTLEENKYKYWYEVVDVSEFGVPQSRKRLVLLASRFGDIELIDRTHKAQKVTVRDAIGHLPPIKHGEVDSGDPLHRSRKLSEINLERIQSTPPNGGNSSSWEDRLVLACHKKKSGKTYRRSVYGRMRWDEPSPTMTTQCVGLGNGRFGHPEQDRAISLREAAIFQTFPENYQFFDPGTPIITKHIAKFIGNAVPVKLGSVIGKSIVAHLKKNVS